MPVFLFVYTVGSDCYQTVEFCRRIIKKNLHHLSVGTYIGGIGGGSDDEKTQFWR